MSFNFHPTIVLEERRCYICGNYYAIETGRRHDQNLTCPFCAADRIKKAEERSASAERSMKSMRGAFALLRKKLRK